MKFCPSCGSQAIEIDHNTDTDYCDSCGKKESHMSEEVEKYIRFKINAEDDRQNMIRALANAGYKVWVESTTHLMDTDFYVCTIWPKE